MKLSPEEEKEIIEATKRAYIEKIKQATIDRVLHDNIERISKHAEEKSAEIMSKLRELFPL